MKVTGRKNLKSFLFAGTSLVVAMSGCKLNSSSAPGSDQKDIHVDGKSNKGNEIDLDFYPVEDKNQITIQLERTLVESGQKEFVCASLDAYHNKLKELIPQNAEAIFNRTHQPELNRQKRDFDSEFKALQQVFLQLQADAKANKPGVKECQPDVRFSEEVKESKQSPRKNDNAVSYILKKDGTFWREFAGGKLCQITTDVVDFKMSQHPTDTALAYYIRKTTANGPAVLWYVSASNASDTANGNNCPSTEKNHIMEGIAKDDHGQYKFYVSDDTRSPIVNAAIGTDGRFTSWADSDFVYRSADDSVKKFITDFQVHKCYTEKGMPYKTYFAFLQANDNSIVAVKGVKEGDMTQVVPGFSSIAAFKEKNHVCPGK